MQKLLEACKLQSHELLCRVELTLIQMFCDLVGTGLSGKDVDSQASVVPNGSHAHLLYDNE